MFFLRNFKTLFCFFRLHYFFQFFERQLHLLANLSEMSRWKAKFNCSMVFTDFYHFELNRTNLRPLLFQKLNETQDLDKITYLEYGVYKGNTIKWWVENNTNVASKFVGFDTFEGLPEAWGHYEKGAMSVNNTFPDIQDSRVTFVKGLFQDTLRKFISENDLSGKLVIHLDADLYSSTLYVLTVLAPFLKKDDIIIFDEFNVPNHEFRAWMDFINSYYIKYTPLVATENYYHCAVRID
jgi:O-methyltransferase